MNNTKYLTGFEKELFDYAKRINSMPDNKERRELVDEYNDSIRYLLMFNRRPLPKECEIDDDLITEEIYFYMRDDFEKESMYTINDHIEKVNIIAEVRITSVENSGFEICAEILKLYKGEFLQNDIRFNVGRGIACHPIRTYEKNKTYLIFLVNRREKYTSIGPKNSIIEENTKKYLYSDDTFLEYWKDIELTVIEVQYGGFLVKMKYEDVIKLIQNAIKQKNNN